jgi:hypothetical protein
MNPEIKEKFIAALESGKYKRARGTTRERGHRCYKYCAVGVLCKLYVNEHKLRNWGQSGVCMYGYPTKKVVEWAGSDFTELNNIIELNDDKKLSFKKIAKKLRETK